MLAYEKMEQSYDGIVLLFVVITSITIIIIIIIIDIINLPPLIINPPSPPL